MHALDVCLIDHIKLFIICLQEPLLVYACIIGLCDNGKSDISISAINYLDKRYYLDNAISKKFNPLCVQK